MSGPSVPRSTQPAPVRQPAKADWSEPGCFRPSMGRHRRSGAEIWAKIAQSRRGASRRSPDLISERAGGTNAPLLPARHGPVGRSSWWPGSRPSSAGRREIPFCSASANYIPMAPNTALAFIILGAGLFAAVSGGRGGLRFAGLGAVLVGLVGVLRLGEHVSSGGFDVDQWFVHVRGGQFGLAPIGKMSLPTATAFVAASTAVVTLAWLTRWKSFGHVVGTFGVATAMTGMVFSLGYLFSPNAPLLYGTESIPMALNTALGFVGLGVGIVTAAGPGAFPLQRLSGPSIRARLLRTFLPLIMGTVGVVAWLTLLVTTTVGASSAAISAAALAVVATLLFGVMCEYIAGRVGGQLERAEAELQQAHDLLEVKVEDALAN